MNKRWIQYIVMILCAGMLFGVFPLFSDRIQLADTEVEWQDDTYINEFGDEVTPIPDDFFESASSEELTTSLLSSDLGSSSPVSAFSSQATPSKIISSLIGISSQNHATSSQKVSSKIPSSALPVSSALSAPSSKPTATSAPVSSKPVSSATVSSKPASSAAPSSQASSSKPTATSAPTGSTPGTTASAETVLISENGKAVQYKLSEILPRIVAAEIGGSPFPEAIKAQAVATHTFLRYYNDLQGSAPSVAQKTPSNTVIEACNAVIDKIITVNGKPVYTPYCAATAGKTNSSADVWGGNLSHLQSVESKYDNEDATNWNRKTTMSVSDVKSKLSSVTKLSITGEPSTWLTRIDYTKGGYNKNMKICGNTTYQSGGSTVKITGRVIREQILKLRSACFEWEVKEGNFIFTTKGYGHGVGLSQMGAIGYARHGYSYERILKHYYTGITLSSYKAS